jgi:hypothetical protein
MQLQELLQDLNARMSAAKTTGFWSDTDKKRWINKSIVRACTFTRWNFINHHSTQLTEKDVEAYFLPFDYKPGGLMFLKIDGQEYVKTSIENYQSDNHLWEFVCCLIGDQYLIKPTPVQDGKIIDIYYRRRLVPLASDTDEPITPEEMDESIVKFALGICLKKEPNRSGEADKQILEATAILQQIKDRQDEEIGEAGFVGQATSSRFLYRNCNPEDFNQ